VRYSTNPRSTLMFPISRDEYAAISVKTTQGFPRNIGRSADSPTITFYLVRTAHSLTTSSITRARQCRRRYRHGQNLELPYRFFDAVTADLAHRFGAHHRRSWEAQRKGDRDEAWSIAATDDTEMDAMYVPPGYGYYRR